MKKLYLFTLSVFIFSLSQAQQTPEEYVKAALIIMKANAVNRATLNWGEIYKTAIAEAKAVKTIPETYPIIKKTLGELKDAHSKFFTPQVVASYAKRYVETGNIFPEPKDSLINGKFAYISIPAIANTNGEDWKQYIQSFYDKIKHLDRQNPTAWLLDIRDNDGGMFSPMLAAIQPFLDQDKVIGSIDNNRQINFYSYRKGKIFFGKQQIATVKVPLIKLKNRKKPIYILTNKVTSSSGEFVTASFVGQKGAKIVGPFTQGLTSDNSEFILPDGAYLVITTGNLIDRTGKEYNEIGKGIEPHIKVKSNQLSDYIKAIEN